MPILDAEAINALHKKNRYCYYCKRPLNGISPRLLDYKVVRGGYRFYHMACFQKSGDALRNSMSGKSTHAQMSLRMKIERRNRHG